MTKRRDTKPASTVPRLPSKDEIVRFVETAQGPVGKREIMRAFSIKGGARIELKALLQDMTDAGLLKGNRKALAQPGKIPPVGLFDIVARDGDGDLLAEPAEWAPDDGPRPRVLVLEKAGAKRDVELGALGVGDRILARSLRFDGGPYKFAVTPMKRMAKEKSKALGIYRTEPRGGGRIEPIDKKEMRAWRVPAECTGGANDGDLVRFDVVRQGRFSPDAAVVEVLGNPNDQRQISLIAVHAHGIPDVFPARVLKEVEKLPRLSDAPLEDWRDLPLVTIDPVDARDHDDAVHARADDDAANVGGFVVTVAIADVSYYVRPGTSLDREARLRGNSCYFPDRVVPMLPERISNDLCSLRELEDRPALAVRLVFDAAGHKRRHTFHRIIMCSAAKLSYEEAQAAIDGKPSAKAAPLVDGVLKPLWAAYAILSKARDQRGPLDLDLPERKIKLDKDGRVADVYVPVRLTAHRLIEEFMIQANVAAAEALEAQKARCVYRVHEPPSKEKLDSLREFLTTVEMKLPQAGQLKSAHFNGILASAKSMPTGDLINEVVLRAQSQAVYSPENLGHFGLALKRYAHFTSPIRRYADLLVHRSLVRALKLGPGGISDEENGDLDATAQLISQAERRAMMAERDTIDRLIAAHLADRIGASFQARISGVTKAGLFVRLKDTGADGFVPISTLGQEYFHYVEAARAIVGDRSKLSFRLGDVVTVKLVDVAPMAGALRFEMLSDGKAGALPQTPSGIRGQRRFRAKQRGRR